MTAGVAVSWKEVEKDAHHEKNRNKQITWELKKQLEENMELGVHSEGCHF